MKKILLISCVLILLSGCTFNKQTSIDDYKNITDKKHYCDIASDCVVSGNDPEGYETCLNITWAEEWSKNPKSKEYIWQCISAGEKTCGCIDNKCQRTDSEPGC